MHQTGAGNEKKNESKSLGVLQASLAAIIFNTLARFGPTIGAKLRRDPVIVMQNRCLVLILFYQLFTDL
jgi:hypothetical protein